MDRRIVDWHTHVWLPEHLGPVWGPELDSKYPARPSTLGGFDEHERAMDEAGIDVEVAVALTSRHLRMSVPNEFVAGYVARRPGRAVGFASVDPNDPDAPRQLRRAARNLGLRGVKLSPPYQAFHPHADGAWAVYRAAADLGLVVMFHQGAVFASQGVLEVANPVLLDRVAREFPELRIIIAHVGQPWWFEVIPMLYKHANVYTDISARTHRSWQLHNILLAAIDYGVIDRFLFGSDYPALRPAQAVEQLRTINERTGGRLPPIPDAVIEGILYERPLSLLGLG